MKSGHIYKVLKARDGRKVTLRTAKWEDLDDLLEFINSLVEEGAQIMLEEKQTRQLEADWLARELAAVENDKKITVMAEVDGKIVGNSGVGRFPAACQSHVGLLGISVKDGYRYIGIGSEMIKVLIGESMMIGLKMLVLDVFDTNKHARHIYEKLGFREIGRIPKGILRNGKYIDEVRMALEL